MSRDYNYDNEVLDTPLLCLEWEWELTISCGIYQGQFFPYFILTMLGLILAPLTYSTFAPSKRTPVPPEPSHPLRSFLSFSF